MNVNEALRELDAQIFLHVFSIRAPRPRYQSIENFKLDFWEGVVPKFTTDISDSMKIVSKLADENFYLFYDGTYWHCSFGGNEAISNYIELAICTAALEKVRDETSFMDFI